MSQRKVVYNIAMTIDHFIAREDETVNGFAFDGNHVSDYLKGLQDFDTVLMGRRTYEWGYQFGIKAGEPSPTYAHMMQYVFSQSMTAYNHPQLQVIREDAADFVQRLKAAEGKDIYLCGGGQLAEHLLNHCLVDSLLIKLNPVAFGKGIPIFGENCRDFALELLDSKVYNNGVLLLHYLIKY